MIFPSEMGSTGAVFSLIPGRTGLLDGAPLVCPSQVDYGHLSSLFFYFMDNPEER